MAALRARRLTAYKAGQMIGYSHNAIYISAHNGSLSRRMATALEQQLGIKPEEYAPLQETQPEPDQDNSILRTDTHTILNHILVMAAELCYREREGKL